MSRHLAVDAVELPLDERLKLVEDIWDSIASVPEGLPLAKAEKELINQRLDARQQNPNAGSCWEDVHARITSRKG
jgi:putative addiction module component (TIGR02574 family)